MATQATRVVTARLVRELANSQNTAAQAATDALDQLWAKTGRTMTPEALRDFMLKAVPALIREYGNAASLAARTWYDRARGDMGDGFHATGGATPDSKAIRGSVRWAMGPAFHDEGDGQGRETTRGRLSQVVDRHVRQAGQNTLERTIRRDGKATGWAIVPQGATCAWCTMLASRAGNGVYYRSRDTARRSVHDHCDCQIVPDWGGGFDRTVQRRLDHAQAVYDAAKAAAGRDADVSGILAAMRKTGDVTDGTGGNPPRSASGGTASGGEWHGEWIPATEKQLDAISHLHDADGHTAAEMARAFADWSGSASAAINRTKFHPETGTMVSRAEAAAMDAAIRQNSTVGVFTVDRLADPRTFGIAGPDEFYRIMPGTTEPHAGYMACSASPGGEYTGSGNTILVRILVPERTHAMCLRDYTVHTGDVEVILESGHRLRVVDTGHDDDLGPMVYAVFAD